MGSITELTGVRDTARKAMVDAKTAGDKGAIDAALKDLLAANAALRVPVEAAMATAKAEGNTEKFEELEKTLLTLLDKKEKKKYEKAKKAAAKAAAGGGAAAAGGKKKSKKQLKKEAAAAKKAAAKAAHKAAAAKGGAPTMNGGKAAPPVVPQAAAATTTFPANTVLFPENTQPILTFITQAVVGAHKLKLKASDAVQTPSYVGDMFANGGAATALAGDLTIAKHVARASATSNPSWYGPAVAAEVDMWTELAATVATNPHALAVVNAHLSRRTFLVANAISLADAAVWAAIEAAALPAGWEAHFPHAARWAATCDEARSFKIAAGKLKSVVAMLRRDRAKAAANATNAAAVGRTGKANAMAGGRSGKKPKEGGNCPPLKGADKLPAGTVTTRFPPEPSGYLHIGHVKAALLNNYYARRYKGRLLLRFDDTNPAKEKEEFEQSIIEDLASLGIVPDSLSHTSDHFELIISKAKGMISDGLAYMDDTDAETMKEERMQCIESKHRTASVKRNLELFEELLKGTTEGQRWCMRAKIDMKSKNGTLRDPVMFRSNVKDSHHRTKKKYKAYPTYDLACPIVDAHEGVTHALRTTEYFLRDEQYAWMQKALKVRKVVIQEFSRLNFQYTVMSKRKLTKLVAMGEVEGWDDARFPTVRGVLRRGVTVPALQDFILSQGFARKNVDMEWDKFWSSNKKFLEPLTPRFMAVTSETKVPMTLTNVPEIFCSPTPLHPKEASMGNKITHYGPKIFIESIDAQALEEGKEVTLMDWGNARVTKLVKDAAGKVTAVEAEQDPTSRNFRKTVKLHWVADVPSVVPVKMVEFDHLITKPKLEEGVQFEDILTSNLHPTRAETMMHGDPNLRRAAKGDFLQLKRVGMFRVEQAYGGSLDKPLELYLIPDGKKSSMSQFVYKLAHR